MKFQSLHLLFLDKHDYFINLPRIIWCKRKRNRSNTNSVMTQVCHRRLQPSTSLGGSSRTRHHTKPPGGTGYHHGSVHSKSEMCSIFWQPRMTVNLVHICTAVKQPSEKPILMRLSKKRFLASMRLQRENNGQQ